MNFYIQNHRRGDRSSLPLVFLLSSLFLTGNSLRDENFGLQQGNLGRGLDIDELEGVEVQSQFPPFVPRDTSSQGKPTWPWNLTTPVPSGTSVYDEHGRIKMGVSSKDCDDAHTHLEMDWDGSPVNYTCFHPESPYPSDLTDLTLKPTLECVSLPKSYLPNHFCMKDPIAYADPIPTYGDHRPLWPIFGEYTFVPTQRWLHSIEHGAIVMLYHPCTHPEEVQRLRRIVRECYGKHVITPSTFLTKERPLALVSWGCKLMMETVDETEVIQFIEQRSMKGPEGTYTKEGQYDLGLIRAANETQGARYDQVTCGNLVGRM